MPATLTPRKRSSANSHALPTSKRRNSCGVRSFARITAEGGIKGLNKLSENFADHHETHLGISAPGLGLNGISCAGLVPGAAESAVGKRTR